MATSSSAIPNFVGRTIDGGRIKLVDVIGEGAYGVVYRAVEESAAGSSSSPKDYAVKVQIKAKETTREGECQAREIVTHKIASNHPNVLTLHQVIEDDKYIYLVTDYCPGGDLFRCVIEEQMYCRNDYLVKKIFIQILDAVQSIHDKGIYHRDLKLDNIFVNAEGTEVYLGDFGLATDVESSTGFACGSSFYMSPECIGLEFNLTPYSTPKADIWALGVILVNMIVGRNPWRFALTRDEHFLQYMANNNYLRTVLPISKSANKILKKIFTFNPNARISIADLRNDILELDTFFMSEEEITTSNDLVRHAAASFAPRRPLARDLPSPAKAKLVSAAGYPAVLPGEEYELAAAASGAVVPAPRLLPSQSQLFTIGTASDSDSSLSSSSSEESAFLRTPVAPAVEDDKILVVSQFSGLGPVTSKAGLPRVGRTSAPGLVEGIEGIVIT